LGVPDKDSTWLELDKVLDRVYIFGDGNGLKVRRTFIDSGGHYTAAVYEYCKRSFAKQRFAIKGQGGPGIALNHKIGKATGSNLPLVMLGVDDGKQQIMNRLAVEDVGARYFHFPLDEDDFPNRGYDELYFKGIISEHKKAVKRNGQIREVWETTQGVRNEPLDLRVYNLACMQSCHPDWVTLKRLLDGGTEKSAAIAANKKAQPKKHCGKVSRGANIW
ncbi:MAG: phage terminase large subunit family protein, partial [Candidatus Cloacimonetes bacterium]|nr:phage terminase large subunit family protein [Candidatus Cloacimonadota bacterium]